MWESPDGISLGKIAASGAPGILICRATECLGSKRSRKPANLPNSRCLPIPPLRRVLSHPLPVQGRTEALSLEVRYVQRNIETDGLDLTVGAGVNNGNIPGGDHGIESELRRASSALDHIDLGPPVPGRRHGKAKQKRVVISVNNTKEQTRESCVLKSVLATVSAIYVHCEVRFRHPFGTILQTSLQETAPVADKLEALISRIIALEEFFGTPAGDAVEKSRRYSLTQYAIVPPSLGF